MTWKNLLFLHFDCSPEIIQRLLPPQFEVETYPNAQGIESAWIGLVPFQMCNVHPPRLPIVAPISNFPETNVRTYVRHRGRSGVYFFSLDAGQLLAVTVARRRFHLPYYWARMKVHREGDHVAYESERHRAEASCKASATAHGPEMLAEPGSLDHFLLERYHFLTTVPSGAVKMGVVDHAPYRYRQVLEPRIEENAMIRSIGINPNPITHAVFVDQVDVVGYRLLALNS